MQAGALADAGTDKVTARNLGARTNLASASSRKLRDDCAALALFPFRRTAPKGSRQEGHRGIIWAPRNSVCLAFRLLLDDAQHLTTRHGQSRAKDLHWRDDCAPNCGLMSTTISSDGMIVCGDEWRFHPTERDQCEGTGGESGRKQRDH